MTQQFENFVNAALDKSLASDVTLPTANKIPVYTGIGRQVTGKTTAELGATTVDITDSTDKRYVTDAQRTRVNTAASSGADGYLTSADWTTFNGKLGLADVRYVFLNDATTTQTTYTVPASAVTEVGRTIIELSNNALTSITINTATGTGKVAGDSVNISITGTYDAQVLAAGAGVTLQGDLPFGYRYHTKTLIYKGSDVWKVVG